MVYRNADHIIANTQGNFKIYTNYFQIPENKITVITNGYDAEEINAVVDQINRKGKGEFSIGYMGFFDKPGFPWKEFLLAIKRMIQTERGIKIRVNICGHVSDNAKRFICDSGLTTYITLHGVLPHSEAITKIIENDVLLLLMFETEYSKAIVPHKLYPYMGMHKPILAIAEENGEVANILRITGTGKVISAKRDDGIYKTLVEYYQEWKNCGGIRYDPNIKEIEKYEVSKLTEKLSYTIRNLT
jgi:glycosyltransferase involved in cell wall biosynthesis